MWNSWLNRTYTVFIMFECWLNSFVFSSFLVYFFKYFTVINIKHVIKMSVFFLIFWCKLEHFVRVIIIASHFFKRKIPKKKFHSLTFLSSTFSGIYSDVPLFFRFYICSITLDFFFITKKHIHKHSPHTKAD